MVAISLYRGNLHRAPDVPRRWLMPTPKISLKDFKFLLHRRSKALSRLRSSSSPSNPNSNPNPNPDLNPEPHIQSPQPNAAPPFKPVLEPQMEPELPHDVNIEPAFPVVKEDGVGGTDAGDCSIKPKDDELPEKDENLRVDEKPPEETKENVEVSEKPKELNEREKRKKDVEEKLQVLNAKKHNLVQVLKQILNTEEELKRRNSTQGMAIRPPGPLQLETMNDSGSMNRIVTPRLGSEANLAGENDGGEADDVSNPNIQSRHVFRMSSTSPSSESPLRRPSYIQHNVVPLPARASMGVTGSPSRFAPTGNQVHPVNPPPAVSLSGTNYVASSPSPAASGGSSVFRDARQPSPWN